jgi:hypothetical protein
MIRFISALCSGALAFCMCLVMLLLLNGLLPAIPKSILITAVAVAVIAYFARMVTP